MTPSEVLTRARNGMNVSVPALAQAVGISRGGLYQAIARGEVEAVTVGRAILVPAHEARRLLCMKSESDPVATIAA